MCGFAALFESQRRFDPELLERMDGDLYHRGPDSGGSFTEIGCALVFRRLSILDPSELADQPMSDPSGRYVIVFNGEIYNFKRLRDELIGTGVVFRSTGDTEVILQGFIRWGEKIIDLLEGMYAFVIWDRAEQNVFAARDPLGIKPLYLTYKDNLLALASESRPLRRLVGTRVDMQALPELLMYRWAAGNTSNLENIELVPGGSCIRFSVNTGQCRKRHFCNILDTFQPDASINETNVLEVVEEAVTNSVKDHLQSDVGYALQLSGGIDSSVVAALATGFEHRKLKSYGVNLGDLPMDESPYRQVVIDRLGLDHEEVGLSEYDFADAFPRAVKFMEGPSPHFGCVMLMLLCERIRHTDKVVLTGEGADELFGGYARYGEWRDLRLKGFIGRVVPGFLWPFLTRYRELKRYVRYDAAIVSSVYHDFLRMHEFFPELVPSDDDRRRTASRFRDFRDRMIAVDQTSYLSSLLMRQDKMAMASSVEARVPFTHYPLYLNLNRIPRDVRIPGGITKPLLKKMALQWFSDDFVSRRKVGLVLPMEKWLENPRGLGRYLDFLEEPGCRLAAYTDRQRIRESVKLFREGKRQGIPSMPCMINVELWLRSLDEPLH